VEVKNVTFYFNDEETPIGGGLFINSIHYDVDGFATIKLIRADGLVAEKKFIVHSYNLHKAIKNWFRSKDFPTPESTPFHHVTEWWRKDAKKLSDIVKTLKYLKKVSHWETRGRDPNKIHIQTFWVERSSELETFGGYGDTADFYFNEEMRNRVDVNSIRKKIIDIINNSQVKTLLLVAKFLGIRDW